MDWEIGTHGLRIKFTDTLQRRRSATYLPEIAAEQGWTKEETLNSLVRKAGVNSGVVDWKRFPDFKVVRYQSSKTKMSFAEYEKDVKRIVSALGS